MSPNKSGGSDDSSPATASGKPLKKGPWTAMEDAILTEYVKKHGEGNWNAVQKNAGLSRCGKSCRLRWANHLRPNLKKGSFSPEEERTILELHSQFGNKWARMATHLPGRTDNEIKNYWNTRIKRRQRAGLPLYPPEIQRKSSNFHHHQQQPSLSPPSPLSSLQQQTQYPSQLPPFSFDPMMNLSAATVPLLANHPHFLLSDPIHRFKRLRENGIIDAAASSSSVPFSSHFPPTPPLFNQNLHTQQQNQQPHLLQFNSGNFDFNPLPLQTTFDPNGIISTPSIPMKLELPSSQITDLSSASLDQTDGGILESLFQGAEVTTDGDDWTKEGILTDPIGGNCSVDNWISDAHPPGPGLGETAQASVVSAGQWNNSSPADSSIGTKIKNEQTDEISSIDDDISSLLDIIPAATPSVSEWYDDGGEMSNGQSSMTNDNITLDLQPFEPSISDADQDWSLGSCPWNNMPRIC